MEFVDKMSEQILQHEKRRKIPILHHLHGNIRNNKSKHFFTPVFTEKDGSIFDAQKGIERFLQNDDLTCLKKKKEGAISPPLIKRWISAIIRTNNRTSVKY